MFKLFVFAALLAFAVAKPGLAPVAYSSPLAYTAPVAAPVAYTAGYSPYAYSAYASPYAYTAGYASPYYIH